MDSRKFLFRQTVTVFIGQAVCTCLMLVVFSLLGKFDQTVLLGGIVGSLLATANFFFMSLGVAQAASKAEKQDVKGGQALVQMSYIGRMIALFVLLVVCAKSGYFDPVALVVPLLFVRPVLSVAELFKKKGDDNA